MVEGLTPYTVYQIYAVVASVDGVVSEVKNASIRTKDDGDKPAPSKVGIKDTTVTITFHEPIQRGTGKVYVSYFAKNTLSGAKPLVVDPGYEKFNPQDIQVDEENLSVSGNSLVVQLPSAPAELTPASPTRSTRYAILRGMVRKLSNKRPIPW